MCPFFAPQLEMMREASQSYREKAIQDISIKFPRNNSDPNLHQSDARRHFLRRVASTPTNAYFGNSNCAHEHDLLLRSLSEESDKVTENEEHERKAEAYLPLHEQAKSVHIPHAAHAVPQAPHSVPQAPDAVPQAPHAVPQVPTPLSDAATVPVFVLGPVLPIPTVVITRKSPKPKKKVNFADESGKQLCFVKVSLEPTDTPPKFSAEFLKRILGPTAVINDIPAPSSWKQDFCQPACQYLQFKNTVDAQMVCLENVLVKNDQCRLIGTIKVKNIAFEKEVFVRLTQNNWIKYEEHRAVYVQGQKGDIFDTFSFDFAIPHDEKDGCQRLEFCVKYKSGELEFWDSNQGKNYAILSEIGKKRAGKDVHRANSG